MSHRGNGRYPRGTTTRYTVHFAGRRIEATVTNDADDADAWVQSVLNSTPMIVGLDCEWRPNLVQWQPENKVAVLQLCVAERCLILQLSHMEGGAPDGLKAFLEGNDATFVGVGVEDDVLKLMVDYGITCHKYGDLEWACGEYLGSRSRPSGLERCALEVLGFDMEKPRRVTMSDWEARTLSLEQIQYACIDAYVSYAVGERVRDCVLRSGLFDRMSPR